MLWKTKIYVMNRMRIFFDFDCLLYSFDFGASVYLCTYRRIVLRDTIYFHVVHHIPYSFV